MYWTVVSFVQTGGVYKMSPDCGWIKPWPWPHYMKHFLLYNFLQRVALKLALHCWKSLKWTDTTHPFGSIQSIKFFCFILHLRDLYFIHRYINFIFNKFNWKFSLHATETHFLFCPVKNYWIVFVTSET